MCIQKKSEFGLENYALNAMIVYSTTQNDKIHSEEVLSKQHALCSEFKCNGIINRPALARDRLEWRKTVLETEVHNGKQHRRREQVNYVSN